MEIVGSVAKLFSMERRTVRLRVTSSALFLKAADFFYLGEFREDNLIDVGCNTFNA